MNLIANLKEDMLIPILAMASRAAGLTELSTMLTKTDWKKGTDGSKFMEFLRGLKLGRLELGKFAVAAKTSEPMYKFIRSLDDLTAYEVLDNILIHKILSNYLRNEGVKIDDDTSLYSVVAPILSLLGITLPEMFVSALAVIPLSQIVSLEKRPNV